MLRTSAESNDRSRPRPFEQAVADATTSLLGTGGASYRVGSTAGAVDTVYLGVFDRTAIEAVGLFDEQLIRNQDYELNIRLRDAGRTRLVRPDVVGGLSTPLDVVGARPAVLRVRLVESRRAPQAPASLELRQLVPPIGIIGVVLGLVVGTRWRPALVIPTLYGIGLAASTRTSQHPIRTAGALVTTHTSWTVGLARSLTRR